MPALGEIALSEAIRRVTEQGGTLNQIRASAGAVVTATTIGTAFLAGIALRDVAGLPWLAWLALTAVVTSTLLALYTLGPAQLGIGVDPATLAQPAWQQLDDGTASFRLASLRRQASR